MAITPLTYVDGDDLTGAVARDFNMLRIKKILEDTGYTTTPTVVDVDKTISTNVTYSDEVYLFNDFTIDAAKTLTLDSATGRTIFYITGNLTISGTVVLPWRGTDVTYSGGNGGISGPWKGGGGSYGAGGDVGGAGIGGVAQSAIAAYTAAEFLMTAKRRANFYQGGTGAGGGSTKGKGKGSVAFYVAGNVTITGTFTGDGEDGEDETGSSSGNGGGGGGTVIFYCLGTTNVSNATFTLNGGDGGDASGLDVSGGGGGSGGAPIICYKGSLSEAGTTYTVTGGAGGIKTGGGTGTNGDAGSNGAVKKLVI